MSKSDRLSLIRLRHAILFGVALGANGFLPVSRAEVSKEARAVKAKVSAQMDDSLSEGDRIEAPAGASSLISSFDSIEEVRETDSNSLLSAAERRQLAREVGPVKAFKAAVRSLPLRLMA
jgi:hypothetical protein